MAADGQITTVAAVCTVNKPGKYDLHRQKSGVARSKQHNINVNKLPFVFLFVKIPENPISSTPEEPNGQLGKELFCNCNGRAAFVCLHVIRHSVLARDWIVSLVRSRATKPVKINIIRMSGKIKL